MGGKVKSAVPTQANDKGLRVNIGIRPEDMIETTSSDYAFEGVVNFTEALGEVTLLYFAIQVGNDAVIGKLPGVHADLCGKTVRMSASADKVQVFHNGQSLHYR
jgi:alpha-glucoside transport system ATP-binding protein